MTIDPQILRFESLPSTNSEAARQALRGAREGLCVVAEEQTAGRGRLRRQWVSPKGAGLYLSIVLKPFIEISRWPLITLMTALAVHDTLVEACGLETDIKWPNDILFEGRKLCGILAETVEAEAGRALVVGIGINLTPAAFPPELEASAISVEAAIDRRPSRDLILQTLVHALTRHYAVLQSPNGHRQIIAAWSDRSSYANGKHIRVSNSQKMIEGITCGLESDGALRVETSDGEICVVRAGDVTLARDPQESSQQTSG